MRKGDSLWAVGADIFEVTRAEGKHGKLYEVAFEVRFRAGCEFVARRVPKLRHPDSLDKILPKSL